MARPKGDNKESKEIRLIKDAKETGEAGESGENKKTGETGETMKRDHIEGRENMSEIKNIKEIKELKEKEGKESGKEISREPLNPEKVKALDLAMKQIKKDFGDGSIMKLGESQSMAVEVISTGSLNLNMALGVGGVPRGRIIEVYGQESSGKTTIALHILAEAQKAGGIGAFIDAEHALDPEYAKNLGVDVDELLISQPDYGEQALEIADMLVRSGAVDVIVVDSVAALVPKVEIDGEMSDQQMGLQARLMSKALRKLTGTLNKSKTTMIFINQIREKIGGFGFGPQTTTTGGKALKFYSSVRMEVKRIGSVKQGDDVIGNETIVKVTKNKVAPPFKEAAFQIMYGRGITRTGEIFELALENNVIAKAGAWFSFGDMRLGQGKENVKAKLEEDKALFAQIESAVLAIMAEHKLKSSKKGSPSVSGEDAGAELREEIA